ncbi:hypothetical protein [Pseudopedobacter beijingensis]|uniref:TonB-dependent receptor n=1 Tax=Pseudopedobacter beijingensis TaxID=1207056 RepID=A0ABW4I681_9SPHI
MAKQLHPLMVAAVMLAPSLVFAQLKTDTTEVQQMKEELRNNIPIVVLDENDSENATGSGGQSISSVLYGGRDPYFSGVFNFNVARFKIRGYDNSYSETYINGVSMKNLTNGYMPWNLWGGLNDVMRGKVVSYGLRPVDFAFGDIGGATAIDIKASSQRPQWSASYAHANRNYNSRLMLSWASGMSKNGWAFAFSGSFRYAKEGYIDGTYYNGASYYAAVDKKINDKHLLSLVTFGTPTVSAGQAAATQEMYSLAGTNYYNPSWGYQNGEKRSANLTTTFQPYTILTHEWKINQQSELNTSVGYSFGERYRTALDWYNAADPRPDYYRNLPSYATSQAAKDILTDLYSNNESYRQINWNRLYDVNRSSLMELNNNGTIVSGRRSRYILEDRVTASNKLNFNSVYNNQLTDKIKLTGGLLYNTQRDRNFKRVNDLLGGDFYLNINQFAERSYPNDDNVNQNDLDNPNRVLYKGDEFGYDYYLNVREAKVFAQAEAKTDYLDYFLAASFSNTSLWRDGLVRNGLYPISSFGKSREYTFNNYNLKGGLTYKLDGRNYFYANASVGNRAPFVENVFISPRNRNTSQANVTSEDVISAEAGYILNWEKLKLRANAYYASFKNGMDVLNYYDDSYQNFVNYALSNIDKEHYGGELGIEVPFYKGFKFVAAANIGRYYYTSRQRAIVTVDNSSEILADEIVYSKNFNVGQTPQEAYTAGINYQGRRNWFLNLNVNYFDRYYIAINPIRRTERALNGVQAGSELWYSILNQEKLENQYTMDLFGGKNFTLKSGKTRLPFSFILGVNNLLNNKQLVSGGYEQLRFDFAQKDANKFPAKYYYAYGINFFTSLTLRF